MKTPSKDKKKSIFSPEYDKIWMFLVPLIAFICCGLILWPVVSDLWDYLEQSNLPDASLSSVRTVEPSFGPSVIMPESDECGGDSRRLVLTASSFERDMTVIVRDENNNVVTGEQLDVILTAPSGEQYRYKTKTDGSCYIVELAAGNYLVSCEANGYYPPESISCTVKEAPQYIPIANISHMIDVVDMTQISPDEMKTEPEPVAQAVVPEVIYTPVEPAYIDMAAFAEPAPVTDALGNPIYTYTFHLGSGGHLLYSGTTQESDVLPVDENGDGVPEYGIRYEPQEAAAEETEGDTLEIEGYYTSVALFNPDNTPVSLYAIDAVPVTDSVRENTGATGWKSENGHTYYIGSDGQYAVGLKNIDGKLCYFNVRGEKAASVGIDVSCFNGHIDWNTVRSQGIDFAIIRLGGRGWSTGTVYEDTFIQEHIQGAKNAGIKVGVYFYSMAVNTVEAVQEASVVLEKLNGIHLDYPVFIDMEYSGDFPKGRADKLATAQRVDIANAFCKTVTSGGYASGIYASESYMRSALDFGSLSRYTYWLANYTENNALPTFSGRYDIWQFTNGGQIGGISGYVDMNVIF